MECAIQVIGWLTVALLIAYLVLLLLAKVLTFNSNNQGIEMPQLIPVTIQTKNQPSFLHKLVVFVTQSRQWELADNWTYKLNDEVTLVIEKGFIFDGASIPRIFWAILSPTGLLLIPGLIHDYGYRYDQIWKLEDNNQVSVYAQGNGKAYWDDLFRKVGNDVNEVGLVNLIARLGVALGGGDIWDKHRKRNKQPQKPVF
ncbi:DUF1353 domain-containing protein [Vibrio brasiliensis]|uniref:DUF1353 domain-containing protein n=1 Tax=Vibrio brasiliensis TaxID=170652 RepID=UPI001EFD61D8|nr:DUF1353 domain-containing protein [Vibrio brasiliensis]MCG9751879.1 DUF1353 domain-containing protein [Vibrio brasiliensis]